MWQKMKNIYHLLNAFLANLFYRFPARNLKVIGVTGTDGKTTVVHLIYEILKAAGKRVGVVSTVKAEIGGREFKTGLHVTTPSPWSLQKFLKIAVESRVEYLILEVTSHALDQHRVFGIPFEIGVLTNVTHEHLDYHKTYENYLAAKSKLLQRAKVAVLNKEDRSYKKIKNQISNIRKKTIAYGADKGEVTSHNFKFTTPLPGEYNKYNCLAAIAVAKHLGIGDKIIRQVLAKFKGVVGRFEFVKTGKDFDMVIDFAHTPNAFENLLKTIRPMVKGRLIHVFGSAGLRDKKKRPIMGKISAKYADIIILTEEDYRTERIGKIITEIERGIRKNPKFQSPNAKLFKILNRQKAIEKAVRLARNEDLVLLTGKGHEKSLCRGKREHPWSEHKAVMRALRALN